MRIKSKRYNRKNASILRASFLNCFFYTICFCATIGLGAVNSAGAQTPVYAGAAEMDITPKRIGYPHYRGVSTGIHDPLYAKAMVLYEGDQKVAVVVCDLLWIERELSSKVRLQVAEKTRIPYSNIIVAGTHTHTGPAYHPNIKELTGQLRPPFDRVEGMEDEDSYPKWLAHQIVLAIAEAHKNAVQVNVEAGKAYAERISYNRRFQMQDGKVRTNAGVGNPEIIRAVGPVDNELGILLIRRAADKVPLISLTNFAIHADTFGETSFGADYPGYLAQGLVEEMGNDLVSIFGAGTCGDINHVDVSGKHDRLSSKEIGLELAKSVYQAIPSLKEIEGANLEVRSEVVFLPLQHFTPEELEWANNEAAAPLYEESKFLERRRRLKIRSLERMRRTEAIPPTSGGMPWTLPLEVQVFSLGKDFAVVGLPGEIFVELGLNIKKASPFKTTMVIELTNTHIAYVPTQRAFAEGGYETINSRLAPGGGELLVESAVRQLNDLFYLYE